MNAVAFVQRCSIVYLE